MSTLGDLLAEHTILPGNAVDHLHAVVGEWQLLADLSFADFLMWVRRDDGALVCVAQVRPNTAPTVLLADAVGTKNEADEMPLVTDAFNSGTIGRQNPAGQQDSLGLNVEAVPVRYNNDVVAVLTHQTALAARKASPLESAYCYIVPVGALCQVDLQRTVGRDGNLLLNVGPRPDGQIEPEQAERLREVGDWLRRYGKSIYATRGGPYLPGDFGVSTYHDKTIYLHVLNPAGKTLSLPALSAKILGCSSLTGGSVTCKQANNSVEITPNGNVDTVDTIIALTLASPAGEIKPITTPVTGKK